MPKQLYKNNGKSTLASSATNSATTLTIQTGDGAYFASPTGGDWQMLTLYDPATGNIEVVKMTARSSATLTVVRGQEGTTGIAWSAGAVVEARLTAGMLDRLLENLSSVTSSIILGSSAAGEEASAVVALGNAANADGALAVAIGSGATADGNNGTAVGNSAYAKNGGVAIGQNAETGTVSTGGSNSAAVGNNASAIGAAATAIGDNTQASGNNSFAAGSYAVASGMYAAAVGRATLASGDNSVAVGPDAQASGAYSIAVQGHASGQVSIAIGPDSNTKAVADYSIALGRFAKSYAAQAMTSGVIFGIARDDYNFGYNGLEQYSEPGSVCTTPYVDLGNVPPWQATASYTDGAVVRPTTPDGYQYHLWHGTYNPASRPNTMTSKGTEPDWAGDGGESEADTAGDHWWIRVDMVGGFSIAAPAGARFFPEEIGFVCMNYNNVTAAPYVSVGTTAAPTKFVNSVQLTQISGANMRHRITSLSSTDGVTELHFKVDTKAAGTNSQFHGRFYVRGFFMQDQG